MNFSAFSKDVPAFLTELKANNSKDWFAANKARYDAGIKAPAQEFGAAMCEVLEQATDLPHSAKLFRVYRDVRFSKDKTPYNAHLHMSFTPNTGQESPPMWFFGLGVDRLSLGCGVFGFDKQSLGAFRDRVAGPDGAELQTALDKLAGAGVRLSEPDLKRVPAPYDKDHPHGALLRRKGLSAWLDVEDRAVVTRPGLVAFTLQNLLLLRPVFDFLRA
ncbi:hypothetical protein ACMU_00525 [Actibacterium mucosum KCTC 23349]|uniref:TIGR02453 family protein n=1 Tax=Actibacterium mucosum KCTC 23349 TaxID=1454373 RepID=A0A037ZLN8_9RHOB|nr:DUF2461 domain-containing protein [Actibacterium mucosum]KAJ57009.1 hypothetical protein ACMU_00525 [Actibacterium mucosum KCTC 23349]